MPCFFDLDSFAFGDPFLFQNVFEPTLPSSPPNSATGEFIPTFPYEMWSDVLPGQTVKQNALSSLQSAPGTPSIQPRATAIPPAKGARNFHVSGGKRSSTSVVVPATPPVSLTSYLP